MSKNLEYLFHSLGEDRKDMIRALEENLGYPITCREQSNHGDEEFLLSLADAYRHVFFSKIWTGPMPEEVKDERNQEIVRIISGEFELPRILDVGCGFNLFRKYFRGKNFLGIDPSNDCADLKISFDEYLELDHPQQDVVICQGNLHFGTKTKVEANLQKVLSVLKPNGLLFVRFNVNRVPTMYPYLDVVDDWDGIDEVVALFEKYITISSKLTIDNGHRIEFYGRKKP